MNKLIALPLLLMFIMTAFVAVTGTTPEPSSVDVNTTGHSDDPTIWNVWGLWGSSGDGSSATSTMSWGSTGIFICLMTSIIASAALGLNIIGSGLSEYTQHVVFVALFFLPLWGLLTMMTSSYFFNDLYSTFGEIFYIGLTIAFCMGVATEFRK